MPSMRPPKTPLNACAALVFFGFAEDVEGRGRGDAPRAGGVRDLACGDSGGGPGGVGMDGAGCGGILLGTIPGSTHKISRFLSICMRRLVAL